MVESLVRGKKMEKNEGGGAGRTSPFALERTSSLAIGVGQAVRPSRGKEL
jgi:hypothetical protein